MPNVAHTKSCEKHTFFGFSDKSPKITKIEKKLLLVSAQIGCDGRLTNHLTLYSISSPECNWPQ